MDIPAWSTHMRTAYPVLPPETKREMQVETTPIEMGTELSQSNTPLLSLYDLFEFTFEERTQVNPARGKGRKVAANKQPVQGNLFGEPMGTEKSGKSASKTPKPTEPTK